LRIEDRDSIDIDMSEQMNVDLSGAKTAIVKVLRQRSKKALFMSEIAASLRRFSVGKHEMEQALAALQAESVIIVRDNFCADPHLENVDLRVAALVDHADGAEGHAAALRAIDMAWNKWLGEYLANHRCG
jgi:hypothetical protein